MAHTMDFIGFTFNGRHSSEFNIFSVSDGSRYQEDLIPSPNDYTEKIPGGVGQYYFGTDMESKSFSLEIAYDNLSEIQLRELRQWLSPSSVGELIFDERPYKEYSAKVGSPPNLSFICFEKTDKETESKVRVYKGEGSIEFVCYYPLAVTKGEKKELAWYRETLDTETSLSSDTYQYTNIDKWATSSGLLETLNKDGVNTGYDHYITLADGKGIQLYNPGDLETDFVLSFDKPTPMNDITFKLSNGKKFVLNLRASDTDVDKYGAVSQEEKILAQKEGGIITIDTKKNRIMYTSGGNTEAFYETSAYFALKEGQFFKIPKNKTASGGYDLVITGDDYFNGNSVKISYNYLYY